MKDIADIIKETKTKNVEKFKESEDILPRGPKELRYKGYLRLSCNVMDNRNLRQKTDFCNENKQWKAEQTLKMQEVCTYSIAVSLEDLSMH